MSLGSAGVIVLTLVALLWIGNVIVASIRTQRRRQHLARERALAEARLQWHTHQAMWRMYEIARQAQSAERDAR